MGAPEILFIIFIIIIISYGSGWRKDVVNQVFLEFVTYDLSDFRFNCVISCRAGNKVLKLHEYRLFQAGHTGSAD